jgi:hypothetical protein
MIFDAALIEYTKKTDIDLVTCPFPDGLLHGDSPDATIQLLQGKSKDFKDFRNGNRKLIDLLRPVVQIVHLLSAFAGNTAGMVSPKYPICFL